jgi:hypothetical protein
MVEEKIVKTTQKQAGYSSNHSALPDGPGIFGPGKWSRIDWRNVTKNDRRKM